MTTPENPTPEQPGQRPSSAPQSWDMPPQDARPPQGRPDQPASADPNQPGNGRQQPGYGYPPPPPDYSAQYGAPADRPAGMPPYASWGQRVAAWLIDNLVAAVGLDLLEAAYYDWGTGVRILSWVITGVGLIWAIYNAYLAGQTGQSTGKRIMHIRLARFVDGQVIGGGYGLLRLFMNFVFWVVCLIPGVLNYLWPLWDAKSQTWSDKIASSVVVKTRWESAR